MIRILLVQDDGSMRAYLSRALERVGYRVTSVERGSEATMRLDRERFDLLLTDVATPELDGIALARQAAVTAPDMRIMFITGFAVVALTRGAAPAEARHLSKPFHLRDLVPEVGRIFEVGTATEL